MPSNISQRTAYRLAAGLAVLFLVIGVAATSARAAEITVREAVAHVMEDPVNGRRVEVYMHISNAGSTRDRLYAVRSNLSRNTMLSVVHESVAAANNSGHDGGGHEQMAKHMQMSVLDVAPGGAATLRHGGSHIMLMEPKATPAVGETFPVTLFFERAGRISVIVTVESTEMAH